MFSNGYFFFKSDRLRCRYKLIRSTCDSLAMLVLRGTFPQIGQT